MDTFMVAARERGAVGGGHRVEAPGWLDGAGVVTAALGSTERTAQVQPARFTPALIGAATTRGATLRIGVVEEIAQRDGAARGVRVGDATIEADAVVLAMGPWTSRAARGLRLPAVHGLKGYSVTLAGADVPAHALFVDYRTADGRALEPEIFPRPDGVPYVCGMADPAPLPESAEGGEVHLAPPHAHLRGRRPPAPRRGEPPPAHDDLPVGPGPALPHHRADRRRAGADAAPP